MLPSVAVIPPAALGPDLGALLATVGWLAIVPVMVALGVLLIGLVQEERELAGTRRREAPPPTIARRPTRAARSAA